MTLDFRVFASEVFGRVWLGGGWRVPLGIYPEQVDFDDVQVRFQSPDGLGTYVTLTRDLWTRYSDEVRISPAVRTDVNLEFRFVRRNSNGAIDRVWYSPYTCGPDSCTDPGYSLMWNPT